MFCLPSRNRLSIQSPDAIRRIAEELGAPSYDVSSLDGPSQTNSIKLGKEYLVAQAALLLVADPDTGTRSHGCGVHQGMFDGFAATVNNTTANEPSPSD